MYSAAPHRTVLAVLLLALGLSSCATPVTKEECMAMDWRTVGFEDGAAGHPASRISVHRKACGEHGVAPDFDLYQAGRSEGLREYCTAANGYRIGAAGGDYAGVCPAQREEDFLKAYSEGREAHAMRERVTTTGNQLASARRDLERAEKALAKSKADAVDEEKTREERAAAVRDTAKLAEEVGKLKARIPQLEEDLAFHRRELDAYLAVHPPIITSR